MRLRKLSRSTAPHIAVVNIPSLSGVYLMVSPEYFTGTLSSPHIACKNFVLHLKQIEERRKKVLIPILLEDLNLNELEFDQDHLAVLRQYLRTYTYMDVRNYKCNIEKTEKENTF